MLNVNLEREREDVIRKIKQKQQQEKDDKAKEDRRRERLKQEEMKREKKEKKRRRSGSSSPKRSPKKSPGKSSEKSEVKEGWRIEIRKNGSKLDTLYLQPDITYTMGRTDSDIKLDHNSCSKNHAKISFMQNR